VLRGIKELRTAGYLKVKAQRYKDNRFKNNRYQAILPPKPSKNPDVTDDAHRMSRVTEPDAVGDARRMSPVTA
jgi:hypothetical protein